ncbi:MAG: hypothetical protein L6U61_03700 [Bacteroidales bacterium]|nr:MAG: hypothetical protein L6U61_03700 [Bacteroidales bacterium]
MVNIPFEIFDYEIYGYAALAIAAIVLSVVTIRRKAALSHWVADNALDADADEAMPLPALSVIVLTSGCDAELLASNIPLMMSQNYPDFEIIVVNADASESVDDAMTLLQVEYPQLRSTFIPDSTANVSKRKLGITLGVKAAKRHCGGHLRKVPAAKRPVAEMHRTSFRRLYRRSFGLFPQRPQQRPRPRPPLPHV